MDIKVVTIVGANGNMGKNVAGIVAGFGKCKVYLLARTLDKAKDAVDSICQTIKSDAIRANLVPKEYSDLEFCVSKSDWIFESIAEDMNLKKEMTQRIFNHIDNKTIVTTGTSGLSISTIAKEISEDKRPNYFGTHFFNPPYNLNLCEIIATEYSDEAVIASFSEYLHETLLRTVIRVKDSPAFLANRVGFQFINRALQLSEKYKDSGGVDYIDYIFQGVTGRSMPPLLTADYVGLDIHTAIVDNLKNNTMDYSNQSFIKPDFLGKIIKQRNFGRKTSCGLYKKNLDGRKEVYDIQTDSYRETADYSFPLIVTMKKAIRVGNYKKAYAVLIADSSQEGRILKNLLTDNAVYSYFVCSQVSDDLCSIDQAMVNGFNWSPPNSWIELFGGQKTFKSIYQKEVENTLLENELGPLLSKVPSSKIDFRRYIKA